MYMKPISSSRQQKQVIFHVNPQQKSSSYLSNIEMEPPRKATHSQIRKHSTNYSNYKEKRLYSGELYSSNADLTSKKQGLMSKMNDNYTFNLRGKNPHRGAYHQAKQRQMSENKMDFAGRDQPLKLFGKLTLHCLRDRRELIENDTKSMESQYSYVINKLSKLKKQQHMAKQREKKQEQLHTQKRKFSEQLKKIYISNQEEHNRRKQELRKSVISHRFNKQAKLQKSREQKMKSASNQRLTQSQIHENIKDFNHIKYEFNREMYCKQKKQDMQRRRKLSKKLESRKIQAKIQFKNKWISEYERAEQSKAHFFNKRQQFTRKIKKALQNYASRTAIEQS